MVFNHNVFFENVHSKVRLNLQCRVYNSIYKSVKREKDFCWCLELACQIRADLRFYIILQLMIAINKAPRVHAHVHRQVSL
jgi:hypothetical protein